LLFEVKDSVDVLAEFGAFLAKSLGIFGLVPDFGLAQLEFYFRQSFLFAVEVKDTP
jgi:hypothetical protein